MAILKAYLKGWETLFKHLRVWGLLYTVNFLLAFFAILPFSGFLGETIGQSLDLQRSLESFNFSLLGDFMNNYGTPFSAMLNQTIGFILLFFLVSIFLMGGLLQSIVRSNRIFAYYDFWKGCGQYFWRLLRLTVYFLFFQAVLFFLCFLLFQLIAGSLSPFELESEVPVIRAFWIVTPIWALLSSLLFLVQDIAKIWMAQKNEFWLVFVIRDAVTFVSSRFLRAFPVYILYFTTFILTTFIYTKIIQLFQADSTLNILGMFLLGQIFILFRIGLKIATLSSLNFLYEAKKK